MLNYSNAREIIRQGISEGIDFAELRKRLPNIRKRPLMGLVFDVLHELGTDQIPFPGTGRRRTAAQLSATVGVHGEKVSPHLYQCVYQQLF